jgi:hypothetical protein
MRRTFFSAHRHCPTTPEEEKCEDAQVEEYTDSMPVMPVKYRHIASAERTITFSSTACSAKVASKHDKFLDATTSDIHNDFTKATE